MDPLESGARAVCKALRAEGHRALFAGGCVRDRLLGVPPKDYDIATDATPDQVQARFPRSFAVGKQFGVITIVRDEGQYEVATFRDDGPYLDGRHPAEVTFANLTEDATRRDFTINALYYDPRKEEVVDLVGGRADLNAGVVRCVGVPEQRFREDHLRMLRAVRFAARLGFAIDEATQAAIHAYAPRIAKTSPERVRDELLKMLCEGGAQHAFQLLDQSGLLRQVLPEISAMKGVAQPEAYHPEGDVFVHTLLLLKQLDSPSATLAMGALLHDVGKPKTQTFEDRIRFNHHDKVGARMARQICQRLKFSNHDTDRVEWLVDQHMRLAAIPQMREAKRRRFVREDGFDELLDLCRMDCIASHGDLSIVDEVREYKANLKPEEVRPVPLITGEDLIALGYTPGPIFKTILTAVEDAQLEGKITTREEAEAMVQRRWKDRRV